MKKILSAILALVLLVSVLPVLPAVAATSGTCGDSITWEIVDGVLTLSGTGEMEHYDWWSNYVPWENEKANVHTLVIEEGITSIGNTAFNDFINLTEVELPSTLKSIGVNAFSGCTSLTEFTIPVGLEKLDSFSFTNCTGMLEYKVAAGNTHFSAEGGVLFNADKTLLWNYPVGRTAAEYHMPDTVTEIAAYAFSQAEALQTVTFSDSLQYIGDEAFQSCYALTAIDLPEGFLSMGGGAFQECNALASISLPSTVTRIGPLCFDATAFYRTLANWDEDVLYSGKYLIATRHDWFEVEGDDSVELSGHCNIKEGTVLIADEAFDFLSDLTGITFPASLHYIGEGAFYGCDGLTEIDIPAGVTHIAEIAFTSCDNLATVTLPKGLQRIGEDAFDGTAFYKALVTAENPIGYCNGYVLGTYSTLKTANIAEGTTLIADHAFQKAGAYVTSITLPESLLYVGKEAFVSCTGVKEISVPKSVVAIGERAFGFRSYYDYSIEDTVYEKLSNFTLNGYTDSAAERYAKEYDIPFRYLDVCEHTYDATVTTAPTCTESGVRTYLCSLCGDSYTEDIPPAHTNVVTDPAVEPGCNTLGKTEGSHCADCGTVVVEQLPVDSLNHITVYDNGIAPDCGNDGRTESLWCEDCQKYIVAPETIPATGAHDPVVMPEKAPTCTEDGSTGGLACRVCGLVTEEPTVLPSNGGHVKKRVPAVLPTCQSTGLTEGWVCTVCGETLVAQTVRPISDHWYPENWNADKQATVGEAGYMTKHCTVCSQLLDIVELPPLTPSTVSCTDNAVQITWDAYPHAYAYRIYRLSATSMEAAANGHYEMYMGTFRGTGYTDTRVTAGMVYGYWVILTDEYEQNIGYFYTDNIQYGEPAPALTITNQPKAVYFAEAGGTVKVHVGAEGEGLTYTWYVKNAGAYTFSKSPCTSDTYSAVMSDGVKDRSVYCVVTDADGNCVASNTAILRMAVTLNAQPTTAYAKSGETAKVTVDAAGDGLTYTWYVKNAGATKFVKSSITSSTYKAKMTDKIKDRSVYCVITDAYGHIATTKTVTLRMAATITTQPTTAHAQSGATAKVTVGAAGDGLKYTWYVKNSGGSKYVKSSITSSTYKVKMTDKVKNRYVYCVVTDAYGNSVKTKTVMLRMAATITAQPKTAHAKSGATAKVTVGAVGDGLKYTWYVKNAGATKYVKSSITSSTYAVKMTSKVKNRYVYCVVTDKYGNEVKTKTVMLRMAATITTQPKTVYAASGATAKVTVGAVGDGLTYTWYVKNAGATKFVKSSISSATYKVKMNSKVKNRSVYCVVTDKYGNTVKTVTVQLKMK